jgi:hypothetical protein
MTSLPCTKPLWYHSSSTNLRISPDLLSHLPAAQSDNEKALSILLTHDPFLQTKPESFASANVVSAAFNPLVHACSLNRFNCIKLLLAHPFIVQALKANLQTYLPFSCFFPAFDSLLLIASF